MAIFESGPSFQTTSGTTAAKLIWTGNSATLGSISPAAALRDLTIQNTGTVTIYVGGGSVTAPAGTYVASQGGGLQIPPGAQMTIQGWAGTTGTTVNDVYGASSSGTWTASAGLASNAWVV